jgi:hypothetical protein
MRHRFARQRIRMGQPIHMRLLTGPPTTRRSSRSASDIPITAVIAAITTAAAITVATIVAEVATIVGVVAIMVVITLMATGKD